jgi:hypothetical protein
MRGEILVESGDAIEALAQISGSGSRCPSSCCRDSAERSARCVLVDPDRARDIPKHDRHRYRDRSIPLSSPALFVGGDGFINTNIEQRQLVSAVRRAASGEIVLEGLPRGPSEIVEGFRQRSRPRVDRT